MQLSQVIDAQNGTTLAEDNMVLQAAGQEQQPAQNNVQENINLDANKEHPFNQRAREMANEATQPQ